MKVGLVQVDGKLPNLALMKIATFHQKIGDEIEWFLGPLFEYDLVYVSKIFKFSDLPILPESYVIGGTGIDSNNRLPDYIEQESSQDSWFLYPTFDKHLGFSESGCRFECSFCVVPEKDGKPKSVSSIQSLLKNPRGQDRLILLDDDFFGQPEWEDKCLEILDLKLKVCFSQGVNIRVLTDNQAEYLSKIKFHSTNFTNRIITFAWDQYRDKKLIKRGFDKCLNAGIKPYQMQFFILIGYDTTPEEDMERIETIRNWGGLPFVMSYDRNDTYQRKLQRWVNHRAIFKSVSWKEYN